ncbi:GNAT family N-acetyltransferase [Paenibacillus glycinis]|uniref:GNAT family N-acetyltransferase n=1 Tax=Paenibacillus glycinis TaxID=2697035 RepID=A0ABW9XWS6_9BACL|nr:GNAT family N-acetyltransferase [Paenibacillus glycinis]NBD26883.1 GNAT family N-acetyltransferase [Paenibacillus glycinis]
MVLNMKCENQETRCEIIASTLIIREARQEDIAMLWEFLQPYSDHENAFMKRVSLKMSDTDHHIAIAMTGAQIVGYAWVQDYGAHVRTGFKTARFHDLIVAEPWRMRGIGRELFQSVKSWSQHRGVRWLQWEASPKAVVFYERIGLTGDPCPQPDYQFFEIEFTL